MQGFVALVRFRFNVPTRTPQLIELLAPRLWIFLSSLQEFFSNLLTDILCICVSLSPLSERGRGEGLKENEPQRRAIDRR